MTRSKHPSHETRASDASTYDEVCTLCGATDIAGGGWGGLAEPCEGAGPMTMHDELRALRDQLSESASTAADPKIAHVVSRVRRKLDAILAKYADWVAVPVEPTKAMIAAANEQYESGEYIGTSSMYRAMIQAAAKAEEE